MLRQEQTHDQGLIHSSTFRLNLSAFFGIGGALSGCLKGVRGWSGSNWGCPGSLLVSETAQVELRSGRVSAPAQDLLPRHLILSRLQMFQALVDEECQICKKPVTVAFDVEVSKEHVCAEYRDGLVPGADTRSLLSSTLALS